MFEGIKYTKFGKAMQEISEIFQPVAYDISKWKKIADIGHLSEKSVKELKEAWNVVPKPTQKKLYKIYKKLAKYVPPKILVAMVTIYLKSLGATISD